MIALAPAVVRLIGTFHETLLLLIAMHDRMKNAPGAKATCHYARKIGARQQLHYFIGLCRLCAARQVAPAGQKPGSSRLLSEQASLRFESRRRTGADGGQAVHERVSMKSPYCGAKPCVIRCWRLFHESEKHLFTPVDKTVYSRSRESRGSQARGCAAIRARMLHFSLVAWPASAMRPLTMRRASHHGHAHRYVSRLSTETTCKLCICA